MLGDVLGAGADATRYRLQDGLDVRSLDERHLDGGPQPSEQ